MKNSEDTGALWVGGTWGGEAGAWSPGLAPLAPLPKVEQKPQVNELKAGRGGSGLTSLQQSPWEAGGPEHS